MTAFAQGYWTTLSQLLHNPSLLILLSLLGGSLLTSWNIHHLKAITVELQQSIADNRAIKPIGPESSDLKTTAAAAQADHRPIVWINGRSKDHSYLKHVHRLFELHGYRIHKTHGGTPPPPGNSFSILWNHEFPFSDPTLRPFIDSSEEFQLINHVPGSGYYTSKVALASLNISGIPPAFAMPKKAAEFRQYAAKHPDLFWVQKSNAHRGIRVLAADEMNLNVEGTFVQQFVRNPLLIDGRKFDIGIYTVITSISPLRVYIYDSDILLRFCAADHEPFNADNVDSYVVGDDYTPLWEMPSFSQLYKTSGLSFKEAFNVFMKRKYGVDAEAAVYSKIRRIIRQVFETQNSKMRDSLKNYRQKNTFFELSRFDFVVDDNFNVFLMEANMSPNLSSGHFEENALLYEALLFDILSLIGAGQRLSTLSVNRDMNVIAPTRQLSIHSEECENGNCSCDEPSSSVPSNNQSSAHNAHCFLCAKCFTNSWRQTLRQTYNEHYAKRGMRRVVPPTLDDREEVEKNVDEWTTEKDLLLASWLAEKCRHNTVFC